MFHLRLINLFETGCVILTGAGRAFAAGADIKEMKDKTYYEMSSKDKIQPWERISKCKIPIIAAVNVSHFIL
jgi:enoyl-CoA hydratase